MRTAFLSLLLGWILAAEPAPLLAEPSGTSPDIRTQQAPTAPTRVVDGLSTFETAQVLGVPQGTVKAQLARARTNLARYMQRALEPRSRTAQRAYRTSRRRKVISSVD